MSESSREASSPPGLAGRSTPAGPLEETTWPAHEAATVMLVRDGDEGPETLLLERTLRSDFAGGALVFPGGKVDERDRRLPAERWRGADLDQWRAWLGADSPEEALGFLVAAVRETFEEADVLLARRDGTWVDDATLASPSFRRMRERLNAREAAPDWAGWLASEGLVLDLGALAPWSWWVTPRGQHKRFDTRFLLARLPDGQSAAHDRVETTAQRWVRPAEALRMHADGEAMVIFPTRRNLQALARHGSATAAWHAARAGEVDLRRVEPELVVDGDRVLVRHPYDGVTEDV